MGNAAAAFLASWHITSHTPSVWVAPLYALAWYGCATSGGMPWWAILVQMLGGAVAALALILALPSAEHGAPPVRLLHLPIVGPRFVLHFIASVVGALAYGFLYWLQLASAHAIDPAHVWQPWLGPLVASALALATDATVNWARRTWVGASTHTPAVRWVLYVLVSMLVVCIDVAAHADHFTALLLPVVWALLVLQAACAPRYK